MNNIAITNGAIGALDFVFRIKSEENSSVLIPDPGFPPYEELANFSNHRVLKYKIAMEDSHSLINWDSVFELINDRTKILLINSPHNPTGKVLNTKEIDKLTFILQAYPNLSLVLDEVYRDLIFEDFKHIDLSSLITRSYFIGSFSKVFPIQGARIGWVTTSKTKLEELLPLFQNVNGAVSSYGQEIAKSFLQRDISFYSRYQESRLKTLNELKKHNLDFIHPQGAFYVFVKINFDDQSFKLQLENMGVKVLSGSNFGNQGKEYIRISFAQEFSIITKAIKLIAKLHRIHNEVN